MINIYIIHKTKTIFDTLTHIYHSSSRKQFLKLKKCVIKLSINYYYIVPLFNFKILTLIFMILKTVKI